MHILMSKNARLAVYRILEQVIQQLYLRDCGTALLSNIERSVDMKLRNT